MRKDSDVDAPTSRPVAIADPREPTSERLLSLLADATEGSRELSREIAVLMGTTMPPCERVHLEARSIEYIPELFPNYTTSLDAALSLVPEGFQWAINAPNVEGEMQFRAEIDYGESIRAPSAPLALCIAAIKRRLL
jgi:hypothetical protein